VPDNDSPPQPPEFPEDRVGASYEIPWPEFPKYRAIPGIFHSLELDGPFRKCLKCERELLNPGVGYMVERIFCQNEPIVEYAMCDRCQSNMCRELSESSLHAIRAAFATVDVEARFERLAKHLGDPSIEPWINECYITGKPRQECRTYQIVGRFEFAELELQLLPLMLSDDAVKMIVEKLSKKTKDQFDDFMDNFTMPPEFAADPDITPILI